MQTYPADFPSDAAGIVVSEIRSGVALKSPDFYEAVWNIQGFAQKELLGNPDTPPLKATVAPISDEQIANMLEQGHIGYGALNVNWGAILQWAITILSALLPLIPKAPEPPKDKK